MERFQTADGLMLAYSDEGPRAALPVLCLAGLTRTTRDFDYLAPHLADCRLIRMDYRGRGRSDWAPDHATYAIPVEAGDALALLDHLGLARVAVIGTSRGGLIAMTLAASAHDRLTGVCLNDIGPVIEQTGLDVIENYLGRDPPYASHTEFAAAKAALMPGFANVPVSRWLQEAQRQSVETETGLKINYDPALRQAFVAAAPAAEAAERPPDLWPLFDAIGDLPLAIIRGANSNLFSAEAAAAMTARKPGAICAEVPDRGHVPFLDEPEALGAIRRWIKQCRSR